MKISESWLKASFFPNLNEPAHTIGERLTMAGLELDDLYKVAPDFTGVVVGQVLTCTQHPDADKLKVTTVTTGQGDPLQIVCGASNVRVGLKVAVATVGAVLPPIDGKEFKIKKGKLRGIESQGMLCGASELGLIDEIDGLLELDDDAPIGADLRTYLHLDSHVLDIAITPNRGDCLSIRGVARELGVLLGEPVHTLFDKNDQKNHTIVQNLPTPHPAKGVQVANAQACPRYLAQGIFGIDRSVVSPKWLKDRLIGSGLRTHNFLVDVTNYVLLELGQPLHAFDADKIVGDICVRLAHAGESLQLLNEQNITLTGDELVIADDVGVLALAGIMGGLRSAVSDETTNIILESAFFSPLAIASRARRFGLHTDASQRFERGVDFHLPSIALDRAISLIVGVAGGELSGRTCVETAEHLPTRNPVSVPIANIDSLLGVKIDTASALTMLNNLQITSELQGDTLICTPPSHRYDIHIKEDIIEELARIYGYDNIAPTLPKFDIELQDTTDLTHELKLTLAHRGYFEAISFSFCDDKIETLLHDDKLGAILPLANPISSELAVMRRTLLSSLIPIVQHNLNRQQHDVRFFETGLSFVGQDPSSLAQIPSLALIATGKQDDDVHGVREMDFFDIKADIESLLPSHVVPSYERADLAFLHSGQSAYLIVDDKKIGYFGQLHPSICQSLDLPCVWVAQLQLDVLTALYGTPSVKLPSKFPSVRRDLAFLVDIDTSWQSLAKDVRQVAGKYLTDVSLFDVYQGDKLPEGKKSLALAMTLQDDHATLSDETIKAVMDAVITQITQNHHAQLRDS